MILLRLGDKFANSTNAKKDYNDFVTSGMFNIGNNGEDIFTLNICFDEEEKKYQLIISFKSCEYSMPIHEIKVNNSFDGTLYANVHEYHFHMIGLLNDTRNKLLSAIRDAINDISHGLRVVIIDVPYTEDYICDIKVSKNISDSI